jgi:hypothetical protein
MPMQDESLLAAYDKWRGWVSRSKSPALFGFLFFNSFGFSSFFGFGFWFGLVWFWFFVGKKT